MKKISRRDFLSLGGLAFLATALDPEILIDIPEETKVKPLDLGKVQDLKFEHTPEFELPDYNMSQLRPNEFTGHLRFGNPNFHSDPMGRAYNGKIIGLLSSAIYASTKVFKPGSVLMTVSCIPQFDEHALTPGHLSWIYNEFLEIEVEVKCDPCKFITPCPVELSFVRNIPCDTDEVAMMVFTFTEAHIYRDFEEGKFCIKSYNGNNSIFVA